MLADPRGTAFADATSQSTVVRRRGREPGRRAGNQPFATPPTGATKEAGTVDDNLAEGGDGRPGEPSNPGRHHGADGGRPVTAPTAGTPTNRACAMMSANSARAMTTVDRARASGRQRPRRRRRRRRRPRGAVVGRTWPRPLRDGATPAWEPRAHSCRYHLSAVCRMARPGSRSVEGA